MSHHQSKGDRSEAQLKKAGRSSGPGHQRSGAPSTAIKGGGAGGPSPSGSAPPASATSLTNSQSFPSARPSTPGTSSGRPTTPGSSSGRPTTPGSSTNRGGKRANGPAGLGRSAQSGGFTDHGGNFRNPHHTGAQHHSQQPQQQPPASAIRQTVGPADANAHTPTSTGQQSESKQATPALQSSNSFVGSRASGTGGAAVPSPRQPSNPVVSSPAAKPPAPVVPSANAAVAEPASPVATASSGDNVRASAQPSFAFQFGSISPGFMNPVPGMQIPARTSSAPPNLDEQKREQARFEASRAVVPKKVPTVPSGQQQVQVTGAVGNTSEQPHPVLQANQKATTQGLITGAGTPVVQPASASQPHGLTQQLVQLPQRQGHGSQHSQAPMHMPATAQVPSQHFQHILVQAQAQAQAQAQHVQQAQAHAQQQQQQQQLQPQPQQQQQVLAPQALPQQSLPQQALGVHSSQGMKYPQAMMPPHGPQIISQQMGSPLVGQVAPQMSHQLGPPMGGPMGGQLSPGISGAQYGPPTTGQFIQPQPSRAIKIVNPTTHEEVRFDAKTKKEPFMDGGLPTSGAASSVRVSSNGPQSRPVNYGSGPHHANMSYYPYTHGGPFNYQPVVPPKSVPAPGGPTGNPSRYPYGQQPHRHVNVPGATSNPPASKGVLSGGMGGGPTGQAGIDMSNSGAAPLVVSTSSGPPHPIIQTSPAVLSGRPAAPTSPMLQSAGGHTPASNGLVSTSVQGSSATISSAPPTPTTPSGVVLKFGDVEASSSAGSIPSGDSPADNVSPPQIPSSGENGATPSADQGVLHQTAPVMASEGPSARRDQGSGKTGTTATTQRPSVSVPPSKLDEVSDLDTLAPKDVDTALDSLANARVAMEEQVGLDSSVDNGVSIPKDTTANTNDPTPSETPSVDKEVVQQEYVGEKCGISDQTRVELTASTAQLSSPAVSETERELETEDISLSKAMETEESVVDTAKEGPEAAGTTDLEGATDRSVSDPERNSFAKPVVSETVVEENVESSVGSVVESGNHPSPPENTPNEEKVISSVETLPNGKLSDDRVLSGSAPTTVSEMQSSEDPGAVEEHNPKEIPENITIVGTNPNTEIDNLSTSVPEVKQVGSKKKKKKEIFAKADAQGSTGDLFTAYKAPEEKKLDEVKRTEASGSTNPGTDTKKDPLSSLEKPVLKELDDWEDAAELPTPKMTPMPSTAAPSVSLVPGEVPSRSDSGVKKYSKDYLMSQRDLHRELPLQFEIRADIADILLNPQLGAGFTDPLPSPGRNLDRQSSGGPRLDRRNSTVGAEEDRWTRNASIASPGRGPSDVRMDMGMGGPPGGFRPGQGNTGLMRMPPGMRPGMGAPGIMPPGMGGILPGGPLLPGGPMMMPPGPGRNLGGVDADRWQRAPVGQKGLIPSPRTPLPAIHKTENRYQVGKISDEEQLKQRLIKGILNKLTPQNFDKLFAQVKEVNIDSATTLTGVISQIFDKALTEPTFCEMYAKFCVQLAVELPEFVEDEEKITFKRVLLNKCQEEFERGEREQEEAEKVEEDGEVKLTDEEREEKRTNARRRMLGNIRFIGELYKKNMLTERIMHECIKKLLGEYQNPDEEDVEALCKLMSTIGRIIDHPKAKEHIDAYFKRMEKLSENMKLSSRLRFMLKDVIDLRRNGWTERRKVEGPKKIDEVHRDAVQERQQAAASSRDRPQQRGGMGPGGRRPGSDFGMRGPPSPMYSSGGQMGGMNLGGLRGAQPPGSVRGGFGQDVRMEDRLLMPDSRPMPMPLSQRPSDEGPLTLGPQGSLGRGMAMRQPIVPGRSALADVPPMMLNDVRRPGMGPMPGYAGMIPDRGPYGGREELSMRGHGAERPLGSADRPLLERPLGPERLGPPMSGRDLRGIDRSPVERLSLGPSSSLRPHTPPTPVAARTAPAALLPLSEEDLKKKSISALTEYFSVRDMKEAAQCVEDLKNPKFHPKMVSIWVSEALEQKDTEKALELLVKLLIYICKEKEPPLLTQEQISKGFELVLSTLEDTTVDVPKAPEYVGRMFAKLVIAEVFSLAHVGKLLKEGGIDPGSLLELGDALNVIGVVLDTIRREKGEAAMVDLYTESKLNLEHFLSPDDNKKAGKFEMFLEKKNLQCLYPMIPTEKYFREAIARDEPAAEILKWVETNVPESISSEPAFFHMVMTEVLRQSMPLDASGQLLTPQLEKVLEGKIKKFSLLLKRLLPKTPRASDASQRHYIVAVQLFANELGHPPGLVSALFSKLYNEDVISEHVFLKWKDDVKDSTPGRDKAIKETFNWFRWLESAPEAGGDDDE